MAIPDRTTRKIIADIEAGELSRNAIAKKHGVAASTVTSIAKRAGLTDAFDRSATRKAVEARQVDLRDLRSQTSQRFLTEANDFLDQLRQPFVAFNFGGRENTYAEKRMDRPPVDAQRQLITSAAIALDKHLAVEKHDSGINIGEATSLLGELISGLTAKHGDGTAEHGPVDPEPDPQAEPGAAPQPAAGG